MAQPLHPGSVTDGGAGPSTTRVQLVLFHSEAWLERVASALRSAGAPGPGLEVAVWDNAPTSPDLRDWCAARGWSYVASPDGNLGYGEGHNRLSRLASEDCEFLLLLNPDGVLLPGTVSGLQAVARENPRAALVEAAQFPIEHPKQYRTDSLETDWCSGACLLARSAAFRELGGFDPRLFMYCEDVDLGWRAWLAGWRCLYVPWAKFLHVTGDQERARARRPALLHQALGGVYLRRRYFGEEVAREFLDSLRPSMARSFMAELELGAERLQVAPLERGDCEHIHLDPGGAYAERRW